MAAGQQADGRQTATGWQGDDRELHSILRHDTKEEDNMEMAEMA